MDEEEKEERGGRPALEGQPRRGPVGEDGEGPEQRTPLFDFLLPPPPPPPPPQRLVVAMAVVVVVVVVELLPFAAAALVAPLGGRGADSVGQGARWDHVLVRRSLRPPPPPPLGPLARRDLSTAAGDHSLRRCRSLDVPPDLCGEAKQPPAPTTARRGATRCRRRRSHVRPRPRTTRSSDESGEDEADEEDEAKDKAAGP